MKQSKHYQAEMYHHLILLRKMRRSLQSRSHLTREREVRFDEDTCKSTSRETKKLTYNGDKELTSRYIVNETASFRSSLQWVHDYEIVLEKGFEGIKEEALERLQQLDSDSPVDQTEKRPFLEAQIITSDAIILWAERHDKTCKRIISKTKGCG